MTFHVRAGDLSAGAPAGALQMPMLLSTGGPCRPGLSQAEALALCDAGLMPLRHYLELAGRYGWSEAQH